MCVIHHNEKPSRVIFHFNKGHLSDPTIPMWVLKSKGQTHYVNHIEFSQGVGFKTKETPDNPHTKGSIQIKGRLEITEDDGEITGKNLLKIFGSNINVTYICNMENGFLKQTAKDYDMSLEEVKRIHELFPETFYEELENHIKIRSKCC